MSIGIRGFNPIWSEVDLTGNQFDDTFYLFVLQNTIPYLPANVYHDPELNVIWNQPIQFLANGTLPVDIFFETNHVYRLEFRKGNTQADPLIYEVDNYIPGTDNTPVNLGNSTSDNQVTNPQFSLISFNSPLSISASNPDPIEVAPGWFFEAQGTGTATITQVPLNSTNTNPSNAPYALELNLSGWTSGTVFLRQRLEQNGMLWANKTVSTAITARLELAPQPISVFLYDSQGAPLTTTPLIDAEALNNDWNQVTGHATLLATTNTDTPPSAYIDYKLSLPSNVDIYVTSIQLLVQDALNISEPDFIQDSINRQIDHTFNYYKDPIIFKQIPSYLVGWDFPLNPAQFGATQTASAIGANKSKYVWDQTIIFQSANSGVGVARGTAGELVLTAAATTQMAVVQYLEATQARKILNAPICINLSAKASVNTVVSVSLWYTTDGSLPVVTTGTNNSIVLTLDSNGIPATTNGTWTQVPKVTGNKQVTIGTSSTTNFNDYPISGWDMEGIAACNTATFFAIVVGTASVTMTNTLNFNSISLQAGSLPTRPSPQTPDEVLRECQYYFEKSYEVAYPLSSQSLPGELIFPIATVDTNSGGTTVSLAFPDAFSIRFNTAKRSSTPVMNIYSSRTPVSSGTVYAQIIGTMALGGTSSGAINLHTGMSPIWTETGLGTKSDSYYVTNPALIFNTVQAANNQSSSAFIALHFDADARLGIV